MTTNKCAHNFVHRASERRGYVDTCLLCGAEQHLYCLSRDDMPGVARLLRVVAGLGDDQGTVPDVKARAKACDDLACLLTLRMWRPE